MASKKPTKAVTSLSIARDGNTFKATWKNPTSSDFSSIKGTWTRDHVEKNGKDTTAALSVGSSATGASLSFSPSGWYPNTKSKLGAIKVKLHGHNDKGDGPDASYTFDVKNPPKPTVSSASYNLSNKTASVTVKSNHSTTSAAMRYDTYVTRKVEKSNAKATSTNTHFTDSEKTLSYDATEAGTLAYDQWVKVTWTAHNRGAQGDGGTDSSSYLIAHPARPQIDSIALSGSAGNNQLVIVSISTNKDKNLHPTETVKLQRAKDMSSGSVPAESNWSDVDGAEDDGESKGFTDYVANAKSADGKYTWYRVKAEARGYTQYSAPKRCDVLFTAARTATDDKVSVESASTTGDYSMLEVKMRTSAGFDADGIEVSWSTSLYAWASNKPPESFELPFTGGNKVATAYIAGLDPGERIFIKARAYAETDDGKEYGVYSNPLTASLEFQPPSVVLSAPQYVRRGDSIALGWTLDTDMQQTHASVYMLESGGFTKCVYSSDTHLRVAQIVWQSFVGRNSVTFRVGASIGGAEGISNHVTVRIVDAPTVSASLSMPAVTPDDASWYDAEKSNLPHSTVLGKQGFDVNVNTGDSVADVVVRVVSEGCSYVLPDGDAYQSVGDVVYATRIGANGEATVSIPYCELIDRCSYKVVVQAVDNSTGLTSDTVEIPFSVLWAHQAGEPSAAIEVVDGAASIAVTAQAGTPETDVCDVYRVSADREYLIAEGREYGTTVVDQYPPFNHTGEPLYYRVATRTDDGDTEFADFAFENVGASCVIDFNDGEGPRSVELPYNLEFTPAIAKDFEERAHIDGSVSGHWNRHASMTIPVNAVLLKDEYDAGVARLARHTGPCFVRLPNGLAFPADVQVSGETFSYSSGLVGVSLNITRVGMTDEWTAD